MQAFVFLALILTLILALVAALPPDEGAEDA